MGWWKTGNAEDIIGDGPADIMMDALAAITERFDRNNGPAISLVEMLDSVLIGLQRYSDAFLESDQQFSPNRLVARLKDGTQVTSSTNPETNEALVQPFINAFRDIAEEYEASELERKPGVSELLATLDFVLGYRSASYQNVTDQRPIETIVMDNV